MSEPELHQTFVHPRKDILSTIPKDTARVPIAPISIWGWGAIATALVFPAELDVGRLQDAISTLGAVWPTLAGRFEKQPRAGVEGQWDFSINLTSSPIPFSTQTVHSSSALPTLDVIQPSLVPYIPPLGDLFTNPNSDAHLLAVRLTTLQPSRSSVLGLNISHVLGDGFACLKMIRVLEALYVHGEAALKTIEKPTFLGHVKVPEWQEDWNLPSITLTGHPREEWIKAYTTAAEENEPVLITLKRAEAEVLKTRYNRISGKNLSTQDAITGWWISLLHRIGEDVKTLIYVINYRTFLPDHPAFPPNLPTLAANVAQMRFINLPSFSSGTDDRTDDSVAVDTAVAVRREILSLRSNPDVILPWLSNAAHHIEQAAVEGKGQILVPQDGHACVNANIKMNWHATFGFPSDETSYHTTFSLRRFLRVFQGNPRKGQKEGDRIELVFSLPKGSNLKEQVAKLVAEDRKGW